jgi:phenylacetate-CoA ligase
MKIALLITALIKLRQMRKRDDWTREQLVSYSNHKLKEIRKYAYAHSSFYKEYHKGLVDAPLTSLPVLGKATMMERFDELVTDKKLKLGEIRDFISTNEDQLNYRKKYWINTTSGSTGSPGIFVFNNWEWSTLMAGFSRMQEFGGYAMNMMHPPKRAIVSSLKMTHMSSLVAKTVGNFLMPMLQMDATEGMEKLVKKLNEYQPHTLVGYASMIQLLAEEQLKGSLNIAPDIVFSSSEVLTTEMRVKIEKAFGKRLFNEYASTEAGALAGECSYHTGLHLLEDNVIVEVVDENNQPVAEGVFGDKLLITVLFSKTQPLIRYELSDSIKLSYNACPCGRPHLLVEDIQGRTEDFLYFDVSGNKVTLHPNKIHEIMESIPLTAWQVVLEEKKLEVFIVGLRKEYPANRISKSFSDLLNREGIRGTEVFIREVPAIPKSASGKTPLIKNLNLKKIDSAAKFQI